MHPLKSSSEDIQELVLGEGSGGCVQGKSFQWKVKGDHN